MKKKNSNNVNDDGFDLFAPNEETQNNTSNNEILDSDALEEIEKIKAERDTEMEEQRKKEIEEQREEKAKKREEKEKMQKALEDKKRAEFESDVQKRVLAESEKEDAKYLSEADKLKAKILKNPKLSIKLKKKNSNPERIEPNLETGLSSEQVDDRIFKGLNNYKIKSNTKTIGQIIMGNVFTFFNILTFLIAAWLISVRSIKDLTFLAIVLANMIIGTVQEIRAKKTIDKLSLISAPTCEVLRDGIRQEISIDNLVLDDLMYLENGKQICSDSIVVDGTIEVNESLLTGESDAIIKRPGDVLYSGSFVVSGNCIAKVDKVGGDNYIESLTGQAKQYKKPNSELLKSLKRIILVMGVIIIPLGVALFIIQSLDRGLTFDNFYSTHYEVYVEIVRKTAGAMIGMIPSGLYLVTSVALAVGVLRLSKNNVLVQELYCIEMLARVDVLCLDKTGTITDGSMSVKNVIDFNLIDGLTTKNIVSAMLNATNDKNLTNVALEEKFGRAKRIQHKAVIPFSSQRKYSAVTFEKYGTFVLGAPEFVMKSNYNLIKNDVNRCAKDGYRVLVIAHSVKPIENGELPKVDLMPVSLILIEDNVRPDAINTISYFKQSGVEVKVISGDNPITVSKVSERAGIENADQYISLDGLSDTEVVRAATKYTVFGRVSPAQKRLLVKTLQEFGKKVAMTGDGVNDILALKEADCSIAVASGSEAARNVSHLVLLDSNFDSMPKVVAEGRRVISNVAKVAKLYLTKTIFSLLLAIVALIKGYYPISTNQLLMIDFLCIGLPSMLLVLEPNNNKAPDKFLWRIIKSAAPGAIVILIQSVIVFLLEEKLDMNTRVTSTIICITATFTCMMVLLETCKPFYSNMRKTLFGSVFSVFIIAIVFVPSFFDFSPIMSWMQYYSKSENIITWETQTVSISVSNHYTVDGFVLDELCTKQTVTHSVEVMESGLLKIDNVETTHKPIMPIFTNSVSGMLVIGGEYIEGINYSEAYEYKATVKPNGDVYIVQTSKQNGSVREIRADYNVLPKVTIDHGGYYFVNGNMATEKTTNQSVGEVTLSDNFDVLIDGKKIGYNLYNGQGMVVSSKGSKLYLEGQVSSTIVYNPNGVLGISGNNYTFTVPGIDSDTNTGIKYSPEINTTSEGYYIVNGYITEYKCSGNGTTITQSITDEGYLTIDGQVTDILIDYEATIGGQVAALPIDCIILLFLMCSVSHPLMVLIKSVVPFTKKQYKKFTDVINRI